MANVIRSADSALASVERAMSSSGSIVASMSPTSSRLLKLPERGNKACTKT